MTALFPFIAVLILTALAPSSLLDLLGVTSPWATPLSQRAPRRSFADPQALLWAAL